MVHVKTAHLVQGISWSQFGSRVEEKENILKHSKHRKGMNKSWQSADVPNIDEVLFWLDIQKASEFKSFGEHQELKKPHLEFFPSANSNYHLGHPLANNIFFVQFL